jgi:hypothetical protein
MDSVAGSGDEKLRVLSLIKLLTVWYVCNTLCITNLRTYHR